MAKNPIRFIKQEIPGNQYGSVKYTVVRRNCAYTYTPGSSFEVVEEAINKMLNADDLRVISIRNDFYSGITTIIMEPVDRRSMVNSMETKLAGRVVANTVGNQLAFWIMARQGQDIPLALKISTVQAVLSQALDTMRITLGSYSQNNILED